MSRAAIPAVVLGAWLTASLAGWSPLAAQQTEPESWDAKYFNPRPAPGDLVLPMPCNGSMAFRPVEIESTGWLDDMKIELGRSDRELGYKEDRRLTHIAGAFTDPRAAHRRLFYMAKYETTVLQYKVFDENCPRPSLRMRLPAVEVSWFDAVAFGRKYTEWLLGNARESLPSEEDTPGYLRLPTEVEWEYAARGGLAVDRTEFTAVLFPMPDGELAEYAWYQGSQSAGSELQLAGLLKPNPLGLHDMIGNAGEIVFEAFRLNRRGRLHGQAGGFVAKGGDVASSRGQLRTAARNELPYFDSRSGAATKQRRLGFRLVLSAPVIVSPERLTEIQEAWNELPAPDLAGGSGQRERKAIEALTEIAAETGDPVLKSKVETVLRDFEQANTERNDSRNRAVRALLRMGAFLGNKVKTDHIRIRSIKRAIEDVALPAIEKLRRIVEQHPDSEEARKALAEADDQLEEMRGRLKALEDSAAPALSYYGDIVITVATDYSKQVIEPQLEAVKVEFQAKKSDYLIRYAELFVNHLDAYREFGAADTSKWIGEIVK